MKPGILSLLVLFVFDWILHGESRIVPQESFDLDQFMGKWYEVAVVSDCPHYMQKKKGNPVIVILDLKASQQGNVTVLATVPRNGSCHQTSTQYASTDTAGQFFYHVPRLGVDVDAYVVRTDYDQYAMLGLLSTEIASQNKTTIFKLYNRSLDVRQAVLDDFQTLVRTYGMRDDIIVNENKVNET
ncbi:protein AMBP-like [Syngnathus acus]|uniref:protein AMBP-like n=1 Tax=Syngnathus acus TaxID=161584 RepID=UPI00188614C3|nr:protein AMBP-like [Syngnathus acus]